MWDGFKFWRAIHQSANLANHSASCNREKHDLLIFSIKHLRAVTKERHLFEKISLPSEHMLFSRSSLSPHRCSVYLFFHHLGEYTYGSSFHLSSNCQTKKMLVHQMIKLTIFVTLIITHNTQPVQLAVCDKCHKFKMQETCPVMCYYSVLFYFDPLFLFRLVCLYFLSC